MLKYIFRRFLLMIPVIVIASWVTFIVIQLPPGDYVSHYINQEKVKGITYTQDQEEALRLRYGLDGNVPKQYINWITGFFTGDMGQSLYQKQSVNSIIKSRFPLTAILALLAMIFTYVVSIPIGLLSAVKQYSVWDYIAMVLGFIGMAIPNFIFALLLMYLAFVTTGNVNIGAMDQRYIDAAWSMEKFLNVLRHFWIPAIVGGTAGTAGYIRLLRANMLDELEKPYVLVAKSKGVNRIRLLFKYPFKMAINPFIVGTAGMLTVLLSGEVMISITLGLPTLGPVLLTAVRSQDMYLAGSIMLLQTILAVVGVLMSDILLAVVDPRIRDSV